MKLSLEKGLDEQQKRDLAVSYGQSKVYRETLILRLLEKIEGERKSSISDKAYDSPGWAYKQADNAGYERAMRELISLLS